MRFLRALCANAHSDHYMYIWQRGYYKGGGRGGGGLTWWNSLNSIHLLHKAEDSLFAFYMKRIQHSSCLFNWIRPLVGVALTPHPPTPQACEVNMRYIWTGVWLQQFTLSSSPHYHSPRVIRAILSAIMMHDILRVILIRSCEIQLPGIKVDTGCLLQSTQATQSPPLASLSHLLPPQPSDIFHA